MLSWSIPKDPDEVMDYQFDWSLRLEEGETIETSTFLTEGSEDFEITDTSIDGAYTTFWGSKGVVGEAVQITNRIGTSGGRTYDQTSTLRIRAR